MNFRTTFFMMGLLAAVGALVYFGRKGPGTEELWRKRDNFFDQPISDRFTRIEIRRDDETIVFEKASGGKDWDIVAPIRGAASSEVIERIKSAIDFLKKVQTFEPGDPKIDRKGWGLDPPKAVLTVKGADADHVFRIGALLPTKKLGYLQLDEGHEVYVIESALHDCTVEKKLSDFRDKSLFRKIDTFAVDRLTIAMEGHEVEVAYQDGAWKVVRPVSDRADAEVINDVLRVSKDLVAKEFVEDGAQEFKKYGLDAPPLTISIQPRGEASSQVVQFGGPKEGDKTKVYARRENSSNVVTVDANEVEKLKRTVSDLRDKKIFDFDEHEIVKVGILRLAKSPPRLGGPFLDRLYRAMGYVRREPIVTLDKASDSWMMTEPQLYPFDLLSVAPWLTEIRDTRVVEFLDNQKPEDEPYRRGADAELVLVLERKPFGASVAQRMTYPLIPLDANRTATWRPNGDRVLVIGSNLIERLRRGPALFRRKMLLDIKSEQVSRIRIKTRAPDDTVSLVEAELDPGPPRTWRLLHPDAGAIEEVVLTEVLRRAGTLVAKDVLTDDPEAVERLRPAKPLLEMEITFGSEMDEGEMGPQNDQKASLVVGEKGDNGYTAIFAVDGGMRVPVAFVLDEATYNDIRKKIFK